MASGLTSEQPSSACQSSGIGHYLQEVLYITIGNTILWCIVVMLASVTLSSALRAKTIYSNRMRRILAIYVVLMTIVCTVSLALTIRYTHRILFSPSDTGGMYTPRQFEVLIGSSTFITLPFAVFGADALMIWRCWVLYQGVHKLLKFTLFCILIFLVFVSLATAVWLFMPLINMPILVLPITGATILTNLLLSILIVSRLLNHERWMNKSMVMRRRASPFKDIIAICVESCAIIIVFALFAISVIWRDASMHLVTIPLTLLPHVCAVAAFLIIIRVANGRSPSTTTLEAPSSMVDAGRSNLSEELPSLQFARPTSSMLQSSTVIVPLDSASGESVRSFEKSAVTV